MFWPTDDDVCPELLPYKRDTVPFIPKKASPRARGAELRLDYELKVYRAILVLVLAHGLS